MIYITSETAVITRSSTVVGKNFVSLAQQRNIFHLFKIVLRDIIGQKTRYICGTACNFLIHPRIICTETHTPCFTPHTAAIMRIAYKLLPLEIRRQFKPECNKCTSCIVIIENNILRINSDCHLIGVEITVKRVFHVQIHKSACMDFLRGIELYAVRQKIVKYNFISAGTQKTAVLRKRIYIPLIVHIIAVRFHKIVSYTHATCFGVISDKRTCFHSFRMGRELI